MKKPGNLQITRKQRDELILDQARAVAEILNMPGWKVIESTILVTKYNAELERKMKLGTSASGDSALYYSGCVDGAEAVRKNVYDVVEAAEKMRADKERQSQMEADNA